MKFFSVLAVASVALAAPFPQDAEPTLTVPAEPTGTFHHRPSGSFEPHSGMPHGTGKPHHPHHHHASGSGVPHHRPTGTGIFSHHRHHPTETGAAGASAASIFHGPFESPATGFVLPTDMAGLPRDDSEAGPDAGILPLPDPTEAPHSGGHAHPTGSHRPHHHATGTGAFTHHRPSGTGFPHHHPHPHGTGSGSPEPTGHHHFGPGEMSPSMVSVLMSEASAAMATGFF